MMNFKPFRAPSFRSSSITEDRISSSSVEPVSKRRKLSPELQTNAEPLIRLSNIPFQSSAISRRPLSQLINNSSPESNSVAEDGNSQYYAVLWRKPTSKKNKTWDDDGTLSFSKGIASLYNNNKGQHIGSAPRDHLPELGKVFSMSGREVELQDTVNKADFLRMVNKGQNHSAADTATSDHGNIGTPTTFRPPKQTIRPTADCGRQGKQTPSVRQEIRDISSSKAQPWTSTRSAFKQPLKENSVLHQGSSEHPIPRHDPFAPKALVFKRPITVLPGEQIVDVVLDPVLGRRLREHQRHGVMFLYECVMNLRDFGGQGCILADDMGLGKTLQTICLIWTLVKQNPIYKADPVVKKVLIVCPVTLVQNWRREFYKWLGRDRLGVMTFDDQNSGGRLSMFDGRNYKVMIVGYERLQKIAEELTRGAGIDLIICDEGHRLKTLKNKSVKAIDTLNTPRRVILSGTPIQNDLTEFYAMVNFVNDGVLGSVKAFTRDFEKPIIKSRQPNATDEDVERGQEAGDELSSTTSPFILRRTAKILSEYLPPKTEYVLFCKPTPEQATLYREILRTPMFAEALNSSETAFQMITVLKKLCNSPTLLRPKTDAVESANSNSIATLNSMLPKKLSRTLDNSQSSKIRLLAELLYHIRTTTDDKVVLVSNYTATLNLMENLLLNSAMTFKRLDGSVPNTKRQSMVDEFNKSSPMACFAFLLSAKAGGVGINLIGGNRLILFDVDWNPATDEQAMARIHRDGQKKPCMIYRFLIKGGIEERIWQRQVVKRGLADSIMEGGAPAGTHGVRKAKAPFSREELKDLFRLDEREGLQTHDLIGCSCRGELDPFLNLAIHDEIDDETVPQCSNITRASQKTVQDFKEQDRPIPTASGPRTLPRKKLENEGKMQELMTYVHLDTSSIPSMVQTGEYTTKLDALELTIADPCLMHLLKKGKDEIAGSVDFIFIKRPEYALAAQHDLDDHVVLE